MLIPQDVRNNVGVRDRSHACETIVLGFAVIDLVAVICNGSFGPLQLRADKVTVTILGKVVRIGIGVRQGVRIKFDGVLLNTATTHPSPNPDGRPLLRDSPTFKVPDQYLFKFAHGGIVVFDEFGKFPDSATDMDCSGWVWYLD
jgi:hypothetical protein